MAFGHRHADCHGQALTQRAGGAFDPGQLGIFGVAGTGAVQLAEIADVIHRRRGVAGQVQQRIDQHRAMPGREHEAVAIGPFRGGGIELEELAEQHGGDIGHAHRHAGVAGIGRLDRVHRKRANGVGHGRKAVWAESHRCRLLRKRRNCAAIRREASFAKALPPVKAAALAAPRKPGEMRVATLCRDGFLR